MKKILSSILLVLSLVPITSSAAGPFDGIYSLKVNANNIIQAYVSVHEINETIVVILLDVDPNGSWQALDGIRIGNQALLRSIQGGTTIFGTENITATVQFQNNINATLNILSCTEVDINDDSDNDCNFSNGLVLKMARVF
jgi:hypothetical protein